MRRTTPRLRPCCSEWCPPPSAEPGPRLWRNGSSSERSVHGHKCSPPIGDWWAWHPRHEHDTHGTSQWKRSHYWPVVLWPLTQDVKDCWKFLFCWNCTGGPNLVVRTTFVPGVTGLLSEPTTSFGVEDAVLVDVLLVDWLVTAAAFCCSKRFCGEINKQINKLNIVKIFWNIPVRFISVGPPNAQGQTSQGQRFRHNI